LVIVYLPLVAVLVWVNVSDFGSASATSWVVPVISLSVKPEPSVT
jgi:hypothetical protein